MQTQGRMPETVNGKPYELEERTAQFSEAILRYAKRIPINQVTHSLVDQVGRSGTSIGANYCEADDSESKKDFRHKIRLCRKESRETKHWLRMMGTAVDDERLKADARPLWQEAKELNLIFASIVRGRADDVRQ